MIVEGEFVMGKKEEGVCSDDGYVDIVRKLEEGERVTGESFLSHFLPTKTSWFWRHQGLSLGRIPWGLTRTREGEK